MDTAELVIDANDELLQTPFALEMVKQLRALDAYDVYADFNDAQVLDPVIMTKERRRDIPVIGDPDEEVIARVKSYYNALSTQIEAKTGLMAVPLVNLTHEGFGRALIMVGKLVVVDKVLRDVHRFGFKSLAALIEEADKIVAKASDLTEMYKEVAKL
ncbi:NifX-associated nitrogen fixation protein [Candidatus Albibeggiatoa sp. nov. NOAA]|uniref:NifX-associated nitrogen fixation protein n=1 Tax=Candidatus Albibeggiatoa sp. nov. NOAA TaxID=3162724 RepID=UPI0032F68369|nr:NifX-associated nitrogen fixation protein [Thiotrichaceae bacterium]